MKDITFTPTGFLQGVSYYSELLLNTSVVDTKPSLQENTRYTYTVTTPGTYIIKVMSSQGVCISSAVVQALFPIVTSSVTDVDCSSNTYSVVLTLTNPTTAGTNITYGWSLQNDCSTVTQWTGDTTITLPADSLTRYIFVKNESESCCNGVLSTLEEPCVVCNLQIINIVFNCNG